MTGASRSRAARSASIITAVAVTILVIENHKNVVWAVTGWPVRTSARPLGDQLYRAVSGYHGGGQAGRSAARCGVLDRQPGACRTGGAPGHRRAVSFAAVMRNTGYRAAIGSNASTGAR